MARDFLLGILESVRVISAEPADRVLVDDDVVGRNWSLIKCSSLVNSLDILRQDWQNPATQPKNLIRYDFALTSDALFELFLEATSSCSSCIDPDIEAVLNLSSMSVKVTFDLASSKVAVAVDAISAASEAGS